MRAPELLVEHRARAVVEAVVAQHVVVGLVAEPLELSQNRVQRRDARAAGALRVEAVDDVAEVADELHLLIDEVIDGLAAGRGKGRASRSPSR